MWNFSPGKSGLDPRQEEPMHPRLVLSRGCRLDTSTRPRAKWTLGGKRWVGRASWSRATWTRAQAPGAKVVGNGMGWSYP